LLTESQAKFLLYKHHYHILNELKKIHFFTNLPLGVSMNLRVIAAQILCRVLKDGQSLTAALDAHLASISEAKDRAFVQALCYGVIRDYPNLEFMLTLLLDKPLRNKDIDIKMLILIGLYQLRNMRVKSHAAVSETVAAVGKKTWARGVINAILRQYLRDQQAIDTKVDSDLLVSSLHPRWILNAIHNDWSKQATNIMSSNNQPPPMTLRVNVSKTSRADYLHLLQRQSIEAHIVRGSETALQLAEAVAVTELPKFSEGWVSVQDAAAQFAAPLLDLQAGQRILDLCAAPGGKTCAILELQPKIAELVAVDIDEKRLTRVAENLQRVIPSGFKNQTSLVVGDATKPQQWWDERLFDRILLDAPCSALGVIRRHPDIKLLRRADDIATLQQLQQEILAAAWTMLASGGVLLYATCSILKAENEQQIAAFLAAHSDSFEIPIVADWGQQCPVGRQILTGDLNMDGFYYARLGKR
jgi:16S rRNA (cytosine967-C5)-methyltransferase